MHSDPPLTEINVGGIFDQCFDTFGNSWKKVWLHDSEKLKLNL